jgi:hypothetical protein
MAESVDSALHQLRARVTQSLIEHPWMLADDQLVSVHPLILCYGQVLQTLQSCSSRIEEQCAHTLEELNTTLVRVNDAVAGTRYGNNSLQRLGIVHFVENVWPHLKGV